MVDTLIDVLDIWNDHQKLADDFLFFSILERAENSYGLYATFLKLEQKRCCFPILLPTVLSST